MAAERKPSRCAAALITSLPYAVLLLLSVPRAAVAFPPADVNTGGEGNQAGPFANPFPDANPLPNATPETGTGTEPATGTGTGTGGVAGTANGANGTPAAGTLAPPDYRYEGTVPLMAGGLPTPGFTVIPRLTLQEEFNDNVLQTETNRRWDFVTYLTPGLTVEANTPRLDLSLQYSPTLEYYARTRSQDAIAQQLYGVGSLVLVPDTLFVDARTFATVTPTNGGYVGTGLGGGTGLATGASVTTLNGYGGATSATGRQNLTQVYGGSVSPYVVHRFGDYGTGTVGVSLTQTYTSDSVDGGSQRATTADANAQFQSGSYFGRVQDTLALNASHTDGTGVLNDARQETITDQLGYALFRQLQVFGVLGYEDIRYSGPTGERIEDAVWRLGATFTPNPRSTLTVSYGHQQGVTGFLANASYAVTARTFVTASYNQSITTYLQQVAAGLNQAGVDQNGVPINAATGQPLDLVNGALAVQDTIYRTNSFDFGVTSLLDRDTLAFTLDHTEETPVSTAVAAGGVAQRSTTGLATWTHVLNERTTSTASLSYGTLDASGISGDSRLFSVAGQLNYALSRTVNTSASYLFFRRRSTEPGFSMYENLVLLSISKRF